MTSLRQDRIRTIILASVGAVAVGSTIVLKAGLSGQLAIADDAIAAGTTGTAWIGGIFEMAKKNNDTFSVGDPVYYDSNNNYYTVTATGNTYAGRATKPALAADTTVTFALNYGTGFFVAAAPAALADDINTGAPGTHIIAVRNDTVAHAAADAAANESQLAYQINQIRTALLSTGIMA